jgi:hypothetical protein
MAYSKVQKIFWCCSVKKITGSKKLSRHRPCRQVNRLTLDWMIAGLSPETQRAKYLHFTVYWWIATQLIDCRALSPGKRIQYICKQGGQTFLIESSALLDRLRAAGSFLLIGIKGTRRNYKNLHKYCTGTVLPDWIQCFGSGLDPYSIRSVDPDPGGQKWPTKIEKIKKFRGLKC